MDRDAFLQAYDRWRAEPFPKGNPDDGLDELHAELAYTDALVADAVLPLAQAGGPVGDIPAQALAELADVTTRARKYESGTNPEHARVASGYRRYAELLRAVVDELD